MEQLLLFCCKSCLRGDDNTDYYTVLGLDPSRRNAVTNDDVKKAYKKLSLSLHPDKLAQRGIEVTAQHKADLIRIKEAYDVLSDPRKRSLYDQIGELGLKMIESPSNPDPNTLKHLLKNFQKNKVDVFYIVLVVMLIFASLLILPILFSLKCDGSIDSVPWIALWTPMWIIDAVFLVSAIAIFSMPSEDTEPEDEEAQSQTAKQAKVPMTFKLFNLLTTILFVLIQVFILVRLDGETSWSWFAVFAPWFAYDGVWFISFIPEVFLTTIKPPEASLTKQNRESDIEDEHDSADAQAMLEYYEKAISQWRDTRAVVGVLLRIWLAIFLALQLNGDVDWNWGLVLLPIWVYLFAQYCFILANRSWGAKLLVDSAEIVEAADGDISSIDPIILVKYQVGKELQMSVGSDCLFQFFPIYLAILLVSRLQLSDFSTFIILIPIFMVLGCCCCTVFCVLMCFGTVDVDELASAMNENGPGSGSKSEDKSDVENASYVPPVVDTKSESKKSPEESAYNVYGTFSEVVSPSTHPNQSPPPPPQDNAKTESVLIEID